MIALPCFQAPMVTDGLSPVYCRSRARQALPGISGTLGIVNFSSSESPGCGSGWHPNDFSSYWGGDIVFVWRFRA